MDRRPLGRSGLELSVVGLGCVTFGREIDEQTSCRILDHAIEKGITWLDTAEGYGGGNARMSRREQLGVDDVREATGELSSSEKIVGRWLRSRGCREQLTIRTKVGSGNSPENIHKALDGSLERLGIDAVDMYELHHYASDVPIGESLAALTAELRAGRVRVIGCSNIDADQLREALQASIAGGYARFEVIEPPYSLLQSWPEDELFGICREEQIAVTTFSPLAAGFLAGKYTPDRTRLPERSRFHVAPGHIDLYFSDRNFDIVERLRTKAAELGLPMVRLAMAWAMTNPDVTSVIVGARKIEHIDNALAAATTQLEPRLRGEMSAWTKLPTCVN